MSDAPVRLERDGGVAALVLDDPPLNLFGPHTYEALMACLDEVEDSDARAMVWRAEGEVFTGREHAWHLERCDRLVDASPDWFRRTGRRAVDLDDPASRAAAVAWWEELTGEGGEGMVVKPAGFVAQGRRGLAQPGIKVRGPEYLRIIYGPEYVEPDNLERLRQRGLGHKRSLAQREYALGLESLDRLARGEPLWRVHECVFAVLALESEPVDPRL